MRIQLLTLILLSSVAVPCFASRTLKDELGRTVEVPDHPHRVICLIPSVVDVVYSLGAGADVVAISDFTKYPKEALQKPSIGLPLNPSIEAIVALRPDLVLGSGDLNVLESADSLQRLGIPVFMADPHGIEGIYASIISIGKALNRDAEAAALVARLRARLAAVKSSVADKPKLRVFMAIWYDPVMTIGRKAFIGEIIEAAGGRSVTDDIAQEWPEISLESIVSRQPDAILFIKGSKLTAEELKTRPGWEHVKAVQQGHFYYVDDRIQYPSPAAFDALEDLAKQFHP
ncbi:MAG: cobalamin transport system substrate-binding protein [Acidobacteriaceae bacterium]|jgi:ABC-type Fe3+-hydroxamate transport system substrate-binding protein|nr:cobalamin transport system substrate-binding protein [Acidobacteriaceae bacterium]